MAHNYPKHAFKSAHEFKAEKRRHVREAIEAVKQLRLGCAYFPISKRAPTPEILEHLEALKEALSVKNWGR